MSSHNLSSFKKNDIGDCCHLKIGIVCSNWNSDITHNLYEGALSTLIDLGVNKENITSLKVPGSFELVYGAKKISKKNIDVIICLGCVIRGETSHFDYICNSVSNGIINLNIELDVPVIFGVLTDETKQQSIDRSGGKLGNKGIEAAVTAVQMALLK
tara:strand:+ start:741 stop:1211 length:471 start_codon:yes stop_codon:yes gene_type:complete